MDLLDIKELDTLRFVNSFFNRNIVQIPLGPVPEEFGITKPTLKTFSKLARDFVPNMKEKPSLILFSDNKDEREAVKKVNNISIPFSHSIKVAESSKYKDSLLFFYAELSDPFTDTIKKFLGVPATVAILVSECSFSLMKFRISTHPKNGL